MVTLIRSPTLISRIYRPCALAGDGAPGARSRGPRFHDCSQVVASRIAMNIESDPASQDRSACIRP